MDGDTVVLIPPSSAADESAATLITKGQEKSALAADEAAALIKEREEESSFLDNEHVRGGIFAFWLVSLGAVLFLGYVGLFMQDDDDVQKDAPQLQPSYSLEKTDYHQCSLMTKEYGIEFYVNSSDGFNEKYPLGTLARDVIENTIITDYVDTIQAYCKYELSKFIRRPDFPTTPFFCSKLKSLGRKT